MPNRAALNTSLYLKNISSDDSHWLSMLNQLDSVLSFISKDILYLPNLFILLLVIYYLMVL